MAAFFPVLWLYLFLSGNAITTIKHNKKQREKERAMTTADGCRSTQRQVQQAPFLAKGLFGAAD